jgi:RNA polymerase sigma-70 factor (ECF subfamily)
LQKTCISVSILGEEIGFWQERPDFQDIIWIYSLDGIIEQDGGFGRDVRGERFLRLLTAHNKRIYAYIFTLVPSYFDADDIMQETVTYMYRNFVNFEPGTNFLAWAFRIARFRVLDFYKKQRDKRIKFDSELISLLEAEAIPVLESINNKLEALQDCRKELSDHDRQLLSMVYDKGISTKNIAERINKSIHSVYRSLARIHDSLLRCIHKKLGEASL